AGASASWLAVMDVDSTDSATNPGYPHDQSPSVIAAYLQDLLNLTALPIFRSPHSTYSNGVLSGLVNPQAADTFFLALGLGNSNDGSGHPLNLFFYCQSE